ncbi:MAG: Ppx/GppA family phosphatase [Paracoccaceae bacterium]|nr:Ppx/GppA family phosphatase [Paracoccaceae bacterium]
MNTGSNSAYLQWDPYQRPNLPQFDERRLSRVGVIDVGSNSVRLVVFDGAARSPAYFYNEKLMCALGSSLSTIGILNPGGRVRAINAIQRFKHLATAMGIPKLTAVATAAVREAKDGVNFCREVYKTMGQKIWIIDGKEEARLSAQGILLGWPRSYGLVCDLGGSSMELAEINNGKVGRCVTSRLGPLKLVEIEGGRAARAKFIRTTIEKLASEMGPQHNRLFLVGGSWRALARIDMARTNYPLMVLHEYRMDTSSVHKTLEFIESNNDAKLQQVSRLSEARFSLVPFAGEVLDVILKVFEPKDIAVSSYGLREGMLYEQMSDDIRARDPLIEACKVSEKSDARVPGMGKSLNKFVAPLFPNASMGLLRLIKAACMLHDVSWRAHPDYRAELCFNNATRVNLGGLKHAERIFLGLALMHRYKNQHDDDRFTPLIELLVKDEIKNAGILGKAMRLGAMMWISETSQRAKLNWDPEAPKLTLRLTKSSQGLFGEAAAARLDSLAASLRCKSEYFIDD